MQVLNRYKNEIIAILVGLALLSIALRVIGVRGRGSRGATAEMPREIEAAVASMPLPAPANIIDSALISGETPADTRALLAESEDGDAEHIRQLAQRDMAATANVLRTWLDQKA